MQDRVDSKTTETSVSKSYWIQVRRAQHWQNLSQYDDAVTALIATGESARAAIYEEVRLFEGRFDAGRGTSEFIHLASLTKDSAHFAAGTADSILNHTRLDLTGCCAPLTAMSGRAAPKITEDCKPITALPSAPIVHQEDTSAAIQGSEQADETHLDTLRFDLLAAKAQQEAARSRRPRRTALLSGALAASVAIGALVAFTHPEPAVRFVSTLVDAANGSYGVQKTASLSEAVKLRNLGELRRLLDAGADPNERDEYGAPALLSAARDGLPMSVDLLLQAGADPGLTVPGHRTVMHTAVEEGLVAPVRQMLRSGAPADVPGGLFGCVTPLSVAAANGDMDMTRLLTAHDAATTPLPGCNAGPVDFAADHSAIVTALGGPAGETTENDDIRLAAGAPVQQSAPATADQGELLEQMELPFVEAPVLASVFVPEKDLEAEAQNPLYFQSATQIAEVLPTVEPQPRAPKQSTVREKPGTLELVASSPAKQPAAGQSTFAVASAGQAIEIGLEETQPRPPRKPQALIKRDWFKDAVAETIENGTVQQLNALLGNKPATADLASLAIDVETVSGITGRTALDYALLQGRPQHAELLYGHGIRPSPDILQVLLTELDSNAQRVIAPVLGTVGIDPNAAHKGKTPLMRAAAAGNADLAVALLNTGASASLKTKDGQRAAEIAAQNGHAGLQELLVIAADADNYRSLMFGLSWFDTLDTVKARAKTCKEVGDGFVACSLNASPLLPDTAAVVVQFDTRDGNRLVAIQVDSKLFSNEQEAAESFDRAATVVSNSVPTDQFGFLVRETTSQKPLFESLSDGSDETQYFQYWPDENLQRSVYVHMKMIGYKGTQGFHRTVIGNPFRVG